MSAPASAANAGNVVRRGAVRATLAVLAVYLPYSALVFIDPSHTHCLWTLLKISPVAPGIVPASLLVQEQAPRLGLAGVVAFVQLWIFVRWALRGSNWSAPLAFAVNLPMGVMLAHLLRA